MNCPRIDVDLRKLRHNTRTVVGRLKEQGIRVTAVTKAVCGHPAIARAMLEGGAVGLAESRLSNVRRLRSAGVTCPITLIRTPMLSQVDDVMQMCEASHNTEITVIAALAAAAQRQKRIHGIILMVEMGDRREGIMPHDLGQIGQQVMRMSGVTLKGIGANFACLGGMAPTAAKMDTLTALANDTEGRCGSVLETVSGGNSANLPWAFGARAKGRINDLRLGEAILLGVDPITGDQIGNLFRDIFTLVAEVIETGTKTAGAHDTPVDRLPAGVRFGPDTAETARIILALGHQDTDVAGLSLPLGSTLIGATSDHLVIGTTDPMLRVGSEMRFQMNYSALMHAMAAPDVQTKLHNDRPRSHVDDPHGPNKQTALV